MILPEKQGWMRLFLNEFLALFQRRKIKADVARNQNRHDCGFLDWDAFDPWERMCNL